MQILFTPWRFSYLTAPKTEASVCIFCIAAHSDDRRSTLTLFRNDRALVMFGGHLVAELSAHDATEAALLRAAHGLGRSSESAERAS